jgi:hypothetical protein
LGLDAKASCLGAALDFFHQQRIVHFYGNPALAANQEMVLVLVFRAWATYKRIQGINTVDKPLLQ